MFDFIENDKFQRKKKRKIYIMNYFNLQLDGISGPLPSVSGRYRKAWKLINGMEIEAVAPRNRVDLFIHGRFKNRQKVEFLEKSKMIRKWFR